MLNSAFVSCDLETTGLNPQLDRIIEIGLVRMENGVVTDSMQTLVNPGRLLSLKIKRITGISDHDLADAPNLAEVLPLVWDFIGDHPVAGHNVSFDLAFLAAAKGAPLPNKAYDTLELARLLLPLESSFRLEALCRSLSIEQDKAHRALDDARATAFLLQELITQIQRLDLNILMQLNGFLLTANSTWYEYFRDLLNERLKSFPDQKIVDRAYWRAGARDGKQGRFPDYRKTDSRDRVELTGEMLESYWASGGPLSRAIPSYECRPQQDAMARSIAGAFNDESFLLLEAGTGVGKSMAYLIPGILWSLNNRERVVVATHTINLQEQLWRKDVPLLREVIDREFKAALVKGRQNYICLRRWINVKAIFPEEAAFYARVLIWLSRTATGDRTELSPFPREEEYWLNICGEAENCLGYRCRYKNDCFVNQAKKAAEDADLIITNHALLLLDIKSENLILPEYGPLIMDEAHHLEDAATNQLGLRVSRSGISYWLNTAARTLEKLRRMDLPDDQDEWLRMVDAALIARQEASESSRYFFMLLGEGVRTITPAQERSYWSRRVTLRLPIEHTLIDDAVKAGEELIIWLEKVTETMKGLINTLELCSITTDKYIERGQEVAQVCHNGSDLANTLVFILACEEYNYVYWLDADLDKEDGLRQCVLNAAPVDVGEILYERFYQNRASVVFTSATLTVNGSFRHFIERTGLSLLPESRLVSVGYDSPFDYENQSLLFLHNDVPVQGTVSQTAYLDELAEILENLLCAIEGRTLVLFTSHLVLRETYHRVQAKLEERDIVVLGHGLDGSRNRILEDFKSNPRSALFGASSFWEGVDVPGESLSCVVMVKLPFWSPKIPVIEARITALEQNNRNSFMDYSVPQAVVRFKQGFGRLIRSGSDRGCVVVLDSRIIRKRYGRYFLQSLPLKNHMRGGMELLTKTVTEWINT